MSTKSRRRDFNLPTTTAVNGLRGQPSRPRSFGNGSSRCSEAIEITPDELGLLNLPNIRPPLQLSRLALLEAARLTAAGSPAQAWEWYRASLRCGRHLGMHAGEIGRLVGLHIHEQSVPPILNWSANSKLGADDLRRALADTQAAYEMRRRRPARPSNLNTSPPAPP